MVQYCKLRLLGMSLLTLGQLHLRRLFRQGVTTAEGMARTQTAGSSQSNCTASVRRFMLRAWFSGSDYG